MNFYTFEISNIFNQTLENAYTVYSYSKGLNLHSPICITLTEYTLWKTWPTDSSFHIILHFDKKNSLVNLTCLGGHW